MRRNILIFAALVTLAIIVAGCTDGNGGGPAQTHTPTPTTTQGLTTSSEEELKAYLSSVENQGYNYYGFGFAGGMAVRSQIMVEGDFAMNEMAVEAPMPWNEEAGMEIAKDASISPTPAPSEISSGAGRVSGTNVQVTGIDEPDIIKVDGENIYYSQRYWYYPVMRDLVAEEEGGEKVSEIYIPERQNQVLKIKAFPPEDLEIEDEIEKTGELLLINDTLVIFNYDNIYGYDVSGDGKAEKEWNIELDSYIVSARLYGDKIYLVTRNNIDYYEPCPIRPLAVNGEEFSISCSRIYHPVQPIPVDVNYNVMVIDPKTGDVGDSVSFMGSSGLSVVYMSTNAIYVTYSVYGDPVKLVYNFLTENDDLISSDVLDKIEKLMSYDISNRAKSVELESILDQYTASLDKDERLKFRNELNDRMQDYQDEHKRDLEKTGIAKIDLDLEVKADGEVPGRVLNQFSLDEYKGDLRIATTVGRWTDSTNDLYVLDEDLEIIGDILDYGEEERIYAVRFIGDIGYIVTFKQTDPFFVMDLSDPTDPEIKGELKIPGYSSYLHPISDDLVLGIGKEDQYVKISLFDVSSVSDPKEIDKYTLTEYYSDVLNNHHAFLIDQKHDIFFLPASQGGYIFSYDGNELELIKAVDVLAQRAVYMDDYLYIVGNKVVVLDENTWEEVEELEL